MSDPLDDALLALLTAQDNKRDAFVAHARAKMTSTPDALLRKAKFRDDEATAALRVAVQRYHMQVKRTILAQRTDAFGRGSMEASTEF